MIFKNYKCRSHNEKAIDDLIDSSMIESGLLSVKKNPSSPIVIKAVDDARDAYRET